MPRYIVRRDARASAAARQGKTGHIEVARRLVRAEERAPKSVSQAWYRAWEAGKISRPELRAILQEA